MDHDDNDDKKNWTVGQRLVATTGGSVARYYTFAVVTERTLCGYHIREVDHTATTWQRQEHDGRQTRTVKPTWDRRIGNKIWIDSHGATYAPPGQRPVYEFREFVEGEYVEYVD